jgi:hypothetical protein
VFIHFDFARSFARGFPFHWSEGNGYSSGGTSLLYPVTLALGYWLGFRKLSLMVWAAVLALVSVFALLLASRRLFKGLPRWTTYLVPPALLSTGVLDWNLFSGMEVALFLAIWGGALIAWDDLLDDPSAESTAPPSRRARAALLSIWGALLVSVRPEAITTVMVFALGTGIVLQRRAGLRTALGVVALVAAPGCALMVAHGIANSVFTGDATAAGARVKLELHHPYLNADQIVQAWWFHFKYQILRLTEYHLAAIGHFGWIAWVFAAVALWSRRTRRSALLLWASAAAWLAIVSLNGQVRWQNERYSMPALTWMLLSAALGVGLVLTDTWSRRRGATRVAIAAAAIGAVALFVYGSRPRFREQLWFFGRASRNILDQHVRAGTLLRHYVNPTPRRVLVGDAGAIPYASDLPALDIIGLGGYRRLPFARATQLGVGAAIELIERVPEAERPDVLAIYPSWWGNFPLWFGERIPHGEVPVRGNVICGGPSKVLYRANWAPLSDSARVFSARPGETVVDSLDLADLISEAEHGYESSQLGNGHLDMKLLVHPARADQALWDAGRILSGGAHASFDLAGFRAGGRTRLVFRVAPAVAAAFVVDVGGREVGTVQLSPADRWQEVSLDLRTERVTPKLNVRLTPRRGEFTLYHLWALQQR